jgi:hypothetical protein
MGTRVKMEISTDLVINIIDHAYDRDGIYGREVDRYLVKYGITFHDPETFLVGLRKLTNAQLEGLLELI